VSDDPEKPALELATGRRVLVLATIIVSSAAYNAATFTATAILPQMQGAMAATQDEISWTVTFNILATAVVMPMTGWLVGRFGRGRLLFWSLVGFTFATAMCGFAGSLESLVVWRIAQGAAGAPLLPLGQTILLDVFPRRRHGSIISIFGMANTIGPVLGPTFAGYLAEYYSWRWGFHMIVPVAFLACVSARIAMPRDDTVRAVALDWTGFVSLSLAITATQMVLSRGQRLDWFQSGEITAWAIVAALSFYVFLVHSLTARRPFLSPRLLLDRNYAIGVFLITIFGMLNFTPMVLLPPLLQNQLGFPDSLIGYMVGWRGVGVMAGSFASLFANRIDLRFGAALGFSLQIVSGLWLMGIDFNVPLWVLCANAFLQGLAVGLIWAPIATSAFYTLDQGLRAEGIAVFHLSRSIGTSFFISITVAEVVRASAANYSRLSEAVNPYNTSLRNPGSMGTWSVDTLSGLGALSKEIARQAALIGYMNAFVMYTVTSAIAIPLVMMLRGPPSAPK
jgi:DHA2 family multidrug resistance protein